MKDFTLIVLVSLTGFTISQGWSFGETQEKSDVAELKKEIAQLTQRIAQLEANANNPDPRVEDMIAFTANGHNNATCVEGEPASMFNRTVSNPGDYYNEANASFTVPIDGLYVFTLNIHSQGDEELNIHIMRDDEDFVGARVYQDGDSATNTVVRSLQSGTVIWTKCMSNGVMSQSDRGKHNTFTGYLVRLS